MVHKVLADTKGMTGEEWLLLRKNGIGGSDAGAVCGLDPYVSSMDVYLDKTQDAEAESHMGEQGKEAVRLGRDLEDYVAGRFMEETGLKVRKSHKMYCHEKYPFMTANVDRLIVGKESGGITGLECKTAGPYMAEKWRNGNIPAHYLAQCHHYMAVLGAGAWYIAVLVLGKEFRWMRIERDEEIIRDLVQIEKSFWEDHVLAGILPEPDGSRAADRFISSRFRESRQDLSIPLEGFDERLKRRMEIEEEMERLTREKQQIEQEVKAFMQDAECAENGQFLVSWKTVSTNRIDAKRLKEEMPEIYKKFCRETKSRRFVVKAA